MEEVFKPIIPSDVFITSLEANELWQTSEEQIIKNRPSGNEFIDTLAQLLGTYKMKKVGFYENAMGLRAGILNQMVLVYSGMSFKEWRSQYILLSAKELLVETNYGLNEIGKRLGFSGIYTFSKWFIRTQNEKPIRWRQAAKRKRKNDDEKLFLQWKKENFKNKLL